MLYGLSTPTPSPSRGVEASSEGEGEARRKRELPATALRCREAEGDARFERRGEAPRLMPSEEPLTGARLRRGDVSVDVGVLGLLGVWAGTEAAGLRGADCTNGGEEG